MAVIIVVALENVLVLIKLFMNLKKNLNQDNLASVKFATIYKAFIHLLVHLHHLRTTVLNHKDLKNMMDKYLFQLAKDIEGR
jgi:hypothetical protein